MKLRTRLIIAFCTMVIGPVLLFSLVLFIYGFWQVRSVERTLGIEFTLNYVMNPIQVISRSTDGIWEEMSQAASEDPDCFLSGEVQDRFEEALRYKRSHLVILKEGRVVYWGVPGEEDTEIRELLPAVHEGDRSGHPVSIGGKLHTVIRQLDITFTDGSEGSAFIVTDSSAVMPALQNLAVSVIFTVIIVLLLTAVAMTAWIYQGINVPINRLRDAAREITHGNLDFTLTAEGEDEISELTRDFENMRSRLKESEEEKERFDRDNRELISNISHDLKTPITSIKGYMEGIMDGVADTPEKIDRYIRTVYAKANDMDRLINELTFYSNIDAKRIPYHFTRLNVAGFFDDCAEELCLELEEKGIDFTYEKRIDPGTLIIADPEQLRRVINNIVSNAEKYMDKPDGKIFLRILDADDFVQVEIEDNGKGIEAKNLANIFDRFYRTDAARSTAKGGSGIGLSIVRKIIEDHSGRIWAGSRIGEGTTLTFVIRKYQESTV